MFKWKDFVICLLLVVCLTLSVVSAFKVEKVQQGAQGIQGERGEKGNTGAQGEQGIQGEKGEQGIQGLRGEKGDQGIQGERGEQGKTGLKGENGKDGLTPYIGEDGFWWIGDTNTEVLAIQPIYAYPYLQSITTNEMQTASPNTVFTNIVLYVYNISKMYSDTYYYSGYIGGITKLRFHSSHIALENSSTVVNRTGFVVCDLVCHGDNVYTIRNALSLEDYAIQYVN